ncbi:hypothetical protein, partial [Bacillus cereus]|uniref:hypothetical protein n=1 Tax=Bacillus cereus TaxID=1396 RepID=UPI00345B695D
MVLLTKSIPLFNQNVSLFISFVIILEHQFDVAERIEAGCIPKLCACVSFVGMTFYGFLTFCKS